MVASMCIAEVPRTVENPIIPGFNPDPSICRVGEDYYLVTSSFAFYPGLPIYHSKDLVNWELIGHAIDEKNIGGFHFDGLGDNDGIWAPTIRHHDGKFYISSTMWKGGGNFILTSDSPTGPWHGPVWVEGASGIDPTIFWDDDGKSYYIGNRYDFKQSWPGQVGIQIQEIDLENEAKGEVTEKKTGLTFEAPVYRLKGDNYILSFGHAMNSRYAEGPHIYKIEGRYYLIMAEGGSGNYHAVTVHCSDSIFGPYVPQQINPVLTHRHLGDGYPVQNIGHADLVQTPRGDWYAVCLGNRYISENGLEGRYCPLGRETWLVEVSLQNGQIVMSPGTGIVGQEVKAPDLPWTPVESVAGEYTPMTMKNIRLTKVTGHEWSYERVVSDGSPEEGIILFRTVDSYYSLVKESDRITLTSVAGGVK
ncbi:MAG: glycoside hydrolase family 43 protein [Muribaculaceae bacterium]|nr:glycoside hydrolase family 43 protein [Muribaculaceae bacterium]